MHGDVVRLGGEVIDDAAGKSGAHSLGRGGQMKKAVVVATATAEAGAIASEAESGAEDEIEVCGISRSKVWVGFPDAKGTDAQVVKVMDFMEVHFLTIDPWKIPAMGGEADEGSEIRFVRKCTEKGDAAGRQRGEVAL